MNPSAIYSKSGKGVQEASGKTSLLKRADRAVLSAIDGRATLGEVAKKVGKAFDPSFEALIAQLDKEGFVREVSGGAGSAAPAPRPAAKPGAPAAKPAAKAAPAAGEDLDFTGIMTSPLKAAPPPKPAVDPGAAKRAKEQEAALYKARQEAESRAQEERDKVRAEAEAKARTEAEAKLRAETEKRLREEAEAKVRAEAEAKAKAVREAAVKAAQEAKAKIEAEAKAKIEAERRAREEAERKAREEAEKARREAEELRLRLEEERKAREEIERKAREEAERKAREEAERRAREEAERKAREEAERKAREEAERKAREEAERKAREAAERKAREEAERARAEAERKAREEAERAKAEAERKAREAEEKRKREEEETRREQEAQMRRAREEADRRKADAERERREAETRKIEPLPELTPPPPPEPSPAKSGGSGLDALMADLDSFSQRDEDERKAKEAAETEAKEERKRKLREEAELREREQAERERREAEERGRQEEEQRRAREEEERRAREEQERERQEAEERAQRAQEALAVKEAQGRTDDIGVTEADLGMDDVRRDEAAVPKESRKARREREREARRLEKEARERDQAAAKAAARAKSAKGDRLEKDESVSVRPVRVRRSRKWGRPVAAGLFLILLAGIGVLHVMPVSTEDYQRAAAEALRQPVRIGSARLSLYDGVRLNLTDVRIGENTRIASARAHPKLGSLFGETKAFDRIELDGVTIAQHALGEALAAKAKGRAFSVNRILIKDLKLEGPLRLPPVEADVRLAGDGTVRTVLLHGPEELLGQLTPRGDGVDFDVTAGSFTLPVAPDVSLSSFAMKGRATRHGMRIEAWGGSVLGGALSGTANLRWGSSWNLDGVLTVRGINAAVFAPALLSEGNAEGTGKFSMSGVDPAKLLRAGRVEGSFTIGKGVLGSVDLSRALRTDGREVNGRTQFVEMNGQGTYNGGAVALRNVTIGAGALQAGASADISQSGALSGRIVADVRTASQSLRTTLVLGGTAADPQVRN